MAKEKKADKEKAGEIKIDDFVGRLRAEITKNYGKDIFLSGKDILERPVKIINWSPALDAALSGGVPTGSWVSVSGRPKTGKAQPLNAIVYTKRGPILMGDITIGDEVCRPNGGWSMVIDLHDQGKKDVYRVCFDDGTFAESCEDHLWNIKRSSWEEEKTLPLKYLFGKTLFNSNGKQSKNKKAVFSIQMALKVDFEEKQLPLHPYLLGILIGDGCFQPNSVRFTNTDNDIILRVKELIKLYNCTLQPQSLNKPDDINYTICGENGINNIIRVIKILGLENKKSDEKFIPKIYLHASYNQRLDLIRGLMDSDGTVSRGNHCSFATTSSNLSKDFQYLINSIGGKCVINEKMTTCNEKGFLSFNCDISFTEIKKLFECDIKKNRCKIRIKKRVRRNIVDIIKMNQAECRCIALDSNDGLYLTDNFIVTHNTYSLLHLAANAQRQHNIPIFYLDCEGRVKNMNLKGVKGLDLSPEKFVVIKSSPEKILSTQDFLNIATSILQTYHGCMLIIDSVSSLADEKELQGGIGTETRGHGSKIVSQFIQNIAQLVSVTNSVVCGITHIIANTSGKGMSTTVEKCANRWQYCADIQLKIKYHDFWKAGGEGSELLGQIVHWEVKTSALGNPYQLCDSYLRYGQGIDEVYEIFKFAETCGLISKAGSWYKIDFLEYHPDLLGKTTDKNGVEQLNDIPKFQGGDAVWRFLTENLLVYERLRLEIKNFTGDLNIPSSEES